MTYARFTPSDLDRFWAKVDRGDPNECWNWRASTNGRGYGAFGIGGRKNKKTLRASHVAYEVTHGPIPAGMIIKHACDNPGCVNPAHLSAGTQAENLADCAARGRARKARGEVAGKAKLTETQVREIRKRDAAGEKHPGIARDLGVSTPAVWAIARRKTWAHVLD